MNFVNVRFNACDERNSPRILAFRNPLAKSTIMAKKTMSIAMMEMINMFPRPLSICIAVMCYAGVSRNQPLLVNY